MVARSPSGFHYGTRCNFRKDPSACRDWGVGGDRRSSRVRLLPKLALEARCPSGEHRSTPATPSTAALIWARFRLVGTQSIDLAGHIVVTGRRKKNVETYSSQRRCRWPPDAVFSAQGQSSSTGMGQVVPIIVIQEAGLDGFWIHRLLQDEGVESHVVDPASIATSRRRRRANLSEDLIEGKLWCERC